MQRCTNHKFQWGKIHKYVFKIYPTEGSFWHRVLSDGIRLHRFRFSFTQSPPLSRDVLLTKSAIYCPIRIFKKNGHNKGKKIHQYYTHILSWHLFCLFRRLFFREQYTFILKTSHDFIDMTGVFYQTIFQYVLNDNFMLNM